jgi:hypothetical protein
VGPRTDADAMKKSKESNPCRRVVRTSPFTFYSISRSIIFLCFIERPTNSMELSPSREAAGFAVTELLSILRNPQVHFRVHKSPPLVPTMSQTNSVHAIHLISLSSILILSPWSRARSPYLYPPGTRWPSYTHQPTTLPRAPVCRQSPQCCSSYSLVACTSSFLQICMQPN